MAGVLLTHGQEHFLKVLFTGESAVGNLYLGLMENGDLGTSPGTHINAQVATGVAPSLTELAEVSAADIVLGGTPQRAAAPGTYVRQLLKRANGPGSDVVGLDADGWNRTTSGGISQVLRNTETSFTVDGTSWFVGGYFVALSATWGAADAIWAESFIVQQQGEKVVGDVIRLKAKFEQKDDHETPHEAP